MANALSDLALRCMDADFIDGGEEGDGDDLWGMAPYCAPKEPPIGIWDDPPQYAALIAQESEDELATAIENELDELNVKAEARQHKDNNAPAKSALIICDKSVAPSSVIFAGVEWEDDLRQSGVIGVRRLVGGNVYHTPTDNFRRKRQRITRPRKAAAKAKEFGIAA